MKRKHSKIKRAILAIIALFSITSVDAATLMAGSCRGISTSSGFKYVGTYCEDFQCTVTSTYIFDSWCPYQI